MTKETEISRIGRLTEAVRKAREGDFPFTIETSGENDELDILADEIRLLVGDLQEQVSERNRAEEALRVSEQNSREIFENSPIGIFRSSVEGKFISANPAVARILKYDSPEEMIRLVNQTSIADAVYVNPLRRQEIVACAQSRIGWKVYEEQFRCKNGSIITCNFHFCALPKVGDRDWEFKGFVIDVTERKRAEEAVQDSNDLLRAIIEAAPTAIIGLDLDGNVRDVWNPAAEKMLGWSADEVMGRPLPSVPLESQDQFQRFREWIRSGKTMNGVEVSRRRRDGTPIDYSIYASPLHGRDGTISGNIAVLVDITERKRADDALRESENRFRLIVETATEGIWQVDREWKTTYVNRRMEEMFGCEPDSMLGLQIHEFMDDEGRRAVAELIANREAGLRETHDFRFVRRDGSLLDTQVSATPLLDERGEFVGSFAMVSDITDRKRTESVLAARMRLLQFAETHTSDELLEATLNELEDLTGSCIGFFHFLEADQQTLRLQNWSTRTRKEFCTAIGKGLHYDVSAAGVWVDCIHQRRPVIHNDYASLPHRKGMPPGHPPVIRELVVPIFRGESIVAIIGVGNKPWYYSKDDVEIVCMLADLSWGIVDRQRAEEALRISEQSYRDIVEHAPFGICHSNREGKLLTANPALARILKYDSTEELLETVNRSSIQDVLFADPPQRGPMLERIFANDSWHVFENRYRCRDGSVVTCEVHSRRIPDQGGDGNEFESFLENITYRLEAEHALRESEEKFRVLAETAPTAIGVYQGDHFVYVNPAAVRLFGYSEAELLKMKFWEWTHPEHRDLVMNRGVARQRGEQVPKQYEHKFVTKAGEEGWVVVSAGRIEYQGKPAGLATFVDITDSKRSAERLQASLAEKVVLLKEVHHRVKNNLQIISSLLDLQADYIHEEYSRKYIRESQERIRSMALVHEQLYKSVDLSYIDFGRYVEELVTFLYQSHVNDQERIKISMDAGNIELAIDDAIPCGLIVSELVSNAFKHAFPGNRPGNILVSCARDTEGTVCLSVVDDGIGLPQGVDLLTTDSLGLQIVGLLTKQLNGTVEMFGEGGGVRVSIRFKDTKGI